MQAPGQPQVSTTQSALLVGASIRAAAESLALCQSIKPIGIDLFGDHDTLRSTIDHHRVGLHKVAWETELAEFLARYPQTPIFCAGQWPAMIDTLIRIGVGDRLYPNPTTYLAAQSPQVIRQAAAQSQLNIPETVSLHTFQETYSVRQNDRWLVKQAGYSGGLGICWADRVFRDNNFCLTDDDRSKRLQRWIAGRTLGASFLCDSKQVHLLGICRALFTRIGKLPFVYCGSVGPITQADIQMGKNKHRIDTDKLHQAAVSIGQQTGLRGFLNIDFMIDHAGRHWILEANPRWSASMENVQEAMGKTSLFALAIKSHLEPDTEVQPGNVPLPHGERGEAIGDIRQPSCWMKRMVWAREDCRFEMETAQRIAGPQFQIRDRPHDGERVRKNSPICSLITRCNDGTDQAYQMRRVIRELQSQLSRC